MLWAKEINYTRKICEKMNKMRKNGLNNKINMARLDGSTGSSGWYLITTWWTPHSMRVRTPALQCPDGSQ
jgi:hypothetical protein